MAAKQNGAPMWLQLALALAGGAAVVGLLVIKAMKAPPPPSEAPQAHPGSK